MWTPKRVGLLVAGFTLFVTAYGVYAHYLGGIDGLPPLPEAYLPIDGDELPPLPPQRRMTEVERKLALAFGQDCDELGPTYAYKFQVRDKGLVLAAGTFEKKDGQVHLAPLSIALFGKPVAPGGVPEINTLRSREAYLIFDRPIETYTDISKSKIVGAKLCGEIVIVNNRRTPQRDDDLSLTTRGPLQYEEARNLVWTDAVVKLVDLQTRPAPTSITATGMDLSLTSEEKTPRPANARPRRTKAETISGVERIVLRSGVEMHLWVDARSGFLAAGKREPRPEASLPRDGPVATLPKAIAAPSPQPPAPDKAHVIITTQGPFCYDVTKDQARFDVTGRQTQLPDAVLVKRLHEPESSGKVDQLECEHLELQFRRKNPAEHKAERSVELEIESVHATGGQVTLTSDAEMLVAHGTELHFDARTRQTILKSDKEMVALKEGNEIHARELRILDQKGAQQATALGPGRIDMLDLATGKRSKHALWKDQLVVSRDGAYELLTLTGEAAFADEEHGQELHGDTLKVWLEAAEPGTPPADTAAAGNGRRRAHHLEAIGRVSGQSREMVIHDTDRFVVWFQDVQAPANEPAAAATHRADKPVDPTPQQAGSASEAAPQADAAKKAQKPIHLSAHLVEAYIFRCGAKNDLNKLRTEGKVRVRQDPVNPGEKGVDIHGDTLQLTHSVDGNLLVVKGGENDLAQVQVNKLWIVGPEVNIDQTTNNAWVNGNGAMALESTSDFQGNKLDKAVPLTVFWNKHMFFNGKSAEFHGGIQAEQENARLACQSLQVFLDRPVSLKEGEKGSPPARVQHLVCDKSVRVEDSVRENGRLVRYQRMEVPSLSLDNEEGVLNAGPGTVRILQPGSDEVGPGRPPFNTRPAAGRAAADGQLRLMRVTYIGRMLANQKTQIAQFWDEVEAVYLPSENPDASVDINQLPPGAMYLRCDRLKVLSRREADNSRKQEMEARGRVLVQGENFFGRAEVVTYNEDKDQVIFDGGEGGLATLARILAPGAPPQTIKGKKILYIRKTQHYQLIDGAGINSSP